MLKHTLKPLVAAVALAALVPVSAQALTSFNALVDTGGINPNIAQDGSAEFVVRKVGGSYQLVTSGDLQVGDIFGGMFFMDSLNGTPISTGTGYTGMIGYYLTEIDTITNTKNKTLFTGGPTIKVADFTFKPVSDLGAWQAVWGVDVLNTYYGLALSPYTMVVVTEDMNQSFTISDFGIPPVIGGGTGAMAEAIDPADKLWATFGFDPADSDHFWTGTEAPLDLSQLIPLWPTLAGTKIGEYGYGLDILDNKTPFVFQHRFPWADYEMFTTAGNLYVPNASNVYTIEDDAKATFIVKVPEPATLGLLGLGLMGMGFALRKRQA